MQIPLNQFEQYIDEIILKRGLTYFKKGNVSQCEEISPNEYEAIVEGTEDYTVRLKIKNDTVVEHSCSCPYDYGSVCKHVAAVFFYLQQDKLQLETTPEKKKTTKSSTKKKTISEQVSELLDKLSHNDLKNFVQEQCNSNSTFRQIFLSGFAHLNTNETQALYSQQVKSILRSAKGRDGYIDWSGIRMVGKTVADLLTSAQKHFENGNYKSSILICSAVMEEMVGALQYADDSNGDIGGNMDAAYDILGEIASKDLPDDIRTNLLENCLSLYNKKTFSGWDWHLGMLRIASQLIKTEEEADNVSILLDKSETSEYEKEGAQEIKYQIIKKTKGDREANKFIEANIANAAFRKIAIETAISAKDYERAVKLAINGVNQDIKNKPGLAMDWYDWLLKIAIAQKDKPKIIEFARLLFTDSIREKQSYYEILKKNVEKDQWNNFVEPLVIDIRKKNRWTNIEVIAGIYINEEWWSKLLELLKERPELTYLQHYEKYLAKDYANELAELYELGVLELMKNSTGRNHYQNACKYMRRMIKLGAREKVNQMIDKFRKQYPQRKALLEELNLI